MAIYLKYRIGRKNANLLDRTADKWQISEFDGETIADLDGEDNVAEGATNKSILIML